MKKLLYLIPLLIFALPAHAQCTGSGVAFSCPAGSTSAQIQTALNAATDGAVITLAAGTYPVTGKMSFSNTKGATIICATAPPTATTPITAWSLTSGVVTFTAVNSLVAGQTVVLSNFGTSTFFNNLPVTVLASGLSGTQFSVQFKFTRADSSGTETGTATPYGAAVTNPCIFTTAGGSGNTTFFGTDGIDGVNTHFYRVSGLTIDLSGNAIPITSWSITGNVATFIATNTLTSSSKVVLSGFGTSTFFNGFYGGVTSPTGSQFSMNFTHANGSGTESGTATPNIGPNYGTIYFDSYSGATRNGTLRSFRIDHNTWQNEAGGAQLILMGLAGIFHAEGVIDHNLVTGQNQAGLLMSVSLTPTTVRANPLGTGHAMFIEDNALNFTAVGNLSVLGCTDGWGDISIVLRHNFILDCSPVVHGQTHNGGPLSYESYSNNLFMDSGSVGAGVQDCFWCHRHQGSGLVLTYSNRFTAYSGKASEVIQMADYRAYSSAPQTLSQVSVSGGNVTFTGTGLSGAKGWAMIRGFTNPLNNVPILIASATTTTATGVATTQVNETNPGTLAGAAQDKSAPQCDGTVVPANVVFSDGGVDGNRSPTATYRGYPCWHQFGRDFAGTLFPTYVWDNAWADTGALITLTANDLGGDTNYFTNQIQANRDYYNSVSASAQTISSAPFNGTTGMGFGTLARRPATCTPTSEVADVGHGGVGYFATDSGAQGTLYGCTAANTWTSIYTPYTYPHPLVSAGTPIATFTPTTVSFGNVTQGTTSSELQISLSNSGGGTLTLTANVTLSDTTNFTLVGADTTCVNGTNLTAGQSCIIAVKANPTGTSVYTSTLTTLSNASSSPDTAETFTVTGITAVPPGNPIGLMGSLWSNDMHTFYPCTPYPCATVCYACSLPFGVKRPVITFK